MLAFSNVIVVRQNTTCRWTASTSVMIVSGTTATACAHIALRQLLSKPIAEDSLDCLILFAILFAALILFLNIAFSSRVYGLPVRKVPADRQRFQIQEELKFANLLAIVVVRR